MTGVPATSSTAQCSLASSSSAPSFRAPCFRRLLRLTYCRGAGRTAAAAHLPARCSSEGSSAAGEHCSHDLLAARKHLCDQVGQKAWQPSWSLRSLAAARGAGCRLTASPSTIVSRLCGPSRSVEPPKVAAGVLLPAGSGLMEGSGDAAALSSSPSAQALSAAGDWLGLQGGLNRWVCGMHRLGKSTARAVLQAWPAGTPQAAHPGCCLWLLPGCHAAHLLSAQATSCAVAAAPDYPHALPHRSGLPEGRRPACQAPALLAQLAVRPLLDFQLALPVL